MATTISPANAQKVWVFAQNPDGTLSPATIGGGGGSGTVTSIATTSPITGGPITTTGTIGCATCTTNAAALTSGNIVNGAGGQATVDSGIASANLITSAAVITNNVIPKGNGARGLVNSSITDNGTTVSTAELVNFSGVGAASTSPFLLNGTIFTGGSATTTFPYAYLNFGVAPTTFSTAGTTFAINAPSGFTGNLIDGYINGASRVFRLTSAGMGQFASTVSAQNSTYGNTITTYNNVATTGNGVPAIYGSAVLSGQTAAKTTTTLFTPSFSGIVRVLVYLKVTTAASVSSTLGGATGVTITYTDATDSVAQSVKVLGQTEAGVAGINNAGNATTSVFIGSIVFNAKAAVAVQYAIDYLSSGTAMAYEAQLRLESL